MDQRDRRPSSTYSSSGQDPAATPAPCAPPSSASRSGLVEKGKLGGTCLHVGCIPTKALLHAAEVADPTRESEQFGVQRHARGHRHGRRQRLQGRVVSRLFKGLTGLIKGRGITVIEGEGRLTGAAHGRRSTARRTPARTSCSPPAPTAASLPGLEVDGERVLTSEHALRLDRVPASVVVLGGGVIGCEFASVWAQLRRRGHDRRGAPPAGRRRGRGVVEGARARLPQAQDPAPHRHAVPERQGHRRRRRASPSRAAT